MKLEGGGEMLRVLQHISRRTTVGTPVCARTFSRMADRTIFERIVAKEIPASVVYEDEVVLAFHDISPSAPKHIVVIPKVKGRLTQLQHSTPDDKATLGHLLWACGEIAKRQGLEEGYRVVINDGPKGCQSVFHLHAHVIGGKQLSWPPGTGAPESTTKG